MKHKLVVIAIFLLSGCHGAKELKIGIAEVDYQPPVGCDMVGNYRGDDYASRGIHDPLYGRAFVAEDGTGTKVAVLTVDICWMRRLTCDMIREYIATHSDIKAENVMVLATHTHSAPKSLPDAPYAVEYLHRAADAVLEANRNLLPASIAVGRAMEDRVSFNRRLMAVDGTVHMCWEELPEGYIKDFLGTKDSELIAVTFTQEGAPGGMIVNFGCHPTTMTGNNWLFSADWPGYLLESLKRTGDEGFIPMFVNGPCGNVTQVDYRRGFVDTFEECQRIGYMLGATALEAVHNGNDASGDGRICIAHEWVPLKRIQITSQQLAWAEDMVAQIEKYGMPPIQKDGIPVEQYAKDWIELAKMQGQVDSVEVMAVRIGELAMIGLPGEIFSEFGKQIKQQSPFKNTVVMGLANDNRKYFPTLESFSQGPAGFMPGVSGYETTPGTTLYEPGSGEKLVEAALQLLERWNL